MSGVICATVRRAMAVASLLATFLLVGSTTAVAAAVEYVPVRVVTVDMALKNGGGASYIALPRKAKAMTATFTVRKVSLAGYRDPVKLRLQLDGLKLPKKLPAGVTPSSDGKALVWTVGRVAPGQKLTIKGTTKVKSKATFSVDEEGSDVQVEGDARTLKRASGRVKLDKPKIGTLSNGERITFRGTIAAATCDDAGVGRVRLWGQFPGHGPLRSPSKANIRGPAAKTPGLCRFDITTGRFVQLETYRVRPYRGRPFKFWVISRVDSKSHKSNTVNVNIDSSP